MTDWSFTDQFPNAEIQTRTWYLLPHSVTTYCVAYNGQLYVDSFFLSGNQISSREKVMRIWFATARASKLEIICTTLLY